jgi:hypothetical protein
MVDAANNNVIEAKSSGRVRMMDLCAESGILFRRAVNPISRTPVYVAARELARLFQCQLGARGRRLRRI